MDKIVRPNEPRKDDLVKLYDICNSIFKNKELFYTKEETKKLKEDKNNKFL